MAHAVGKAAGAQSTSVHAIVKHLVLTTPFNGILGQAHDPWFFAKNPGQGADCFTTAVYIAAILDLIGAQGTILTVILYVRPKDGIRWRALEPEEPGRPIHSTGPFASGLAKVQLLDAVRRGDFQVVEEWNVRNPDYAGMFRPKLFHPSGDRFLFLIDHKGGKNKYEGCVKLTAEGKTLWYPAGTLLGGIESPEKIVNDVFESFKWADAKTEKIVGDVAD